MLALLVACETMYGPVQTPIAADKAGEITITIDEVKDSSVTFTVAPQSNSGYYSYLVQLGDMPATIDVNTLYSNGYKESDGTVSSGSIKWTEEKKSSTITLKKLSPNTAYQIYAVASSPMGIVGKHVNANFKTSDKVAPTIKGYETADSVAVITFDEPVVRGVGQIVAGVYAMNSSEIETGTAIGAIEIEEDWIKVNGANVEINVKGLPAGAFYSINYPAGAFTDVSNNAAVELASAVFFGQETGYEPVYEGVGGRNALIEWAFEDITAPIADWTFPIAIEPNTPYGIGYCYRKPVTLAYTKGPEKKTIFSLEYDVNYGLDRQGNLLIVLPERPETGASVMVNVPAELFEDFYGNLNAEWSGKTNVLFDMSVPFDNVVGNYLFTEGNGLTLKFATTAMTIEKSDDPVKGNIMLTKYSGFDANVSPIYGEYDPEAGKLIFAAQQIFSKVENQYLMFTSIAVSSNGQVGVGSDPVEWYLVAPNTIKGANSYYGIVILNSNGAVSGYYTAILPDYVDAILAPAEEQPETASFRDSNCFPVGSTLIMR